MIKKLISALHAASPASHKGQNGKLMVVAGSAQYHGAAMLAVLAARRFVDLVYFYPAEEDEPLIHTVKTIPDVILDYNLSRIQEMDAVLFGNGVDDVQVPLDTIVRKSRKLVIDGDGLKQIQGKIPSGALLTPHESEFHRLFGMEGNKANVQKMAKKHSCVILKKDPQGDIITDGTKLAINTLHNPGMTKGGTGDVLAGLTAALACTNDLFTSAACAAYINGYAAEILRKRLGYSFCASDLAEQLGEAYFRLRKK